MHKKPNARRTRNLSVENLEGRRLLAQMLVAAPASATAQIGQKFSVMTNYSTVPAEQTAGVNVRLHFNPDLVNLDLADVTTPMGQPGTFGPPSIGTETAATTDNDPTTTQFVLVSFAAQAGGFTFPEELTPLFNTMFTAKAAGTANFNYTFATPVGSTNATGATVTIDAANQAPVLATIGPKSVIVNNALTFTAMATDPDADSMTFSLDGSPPAGATIDQNTGAFSFTPTTTGEFDVTFRVTDDGTPSLNDIETIRITVNADPTGPQQILTATPANQSAKINEKFNIATNYSTVPSTMTAGVNVRLHFNPNLVSLDLADVTTPIGQPGTFGPPSVGTETAATTDNDPTTTQFVLVSFAAQAGGFTFPEALTPLFNTMFTATAAGTANFNYTFATPVGTTNETGATVNIEAANQAPVITSAAAASVPENQTSAIDVNATDADGDTLTYAISGGVDQNAFAINAATGVITFKSAPDFENPSDAGANNVYDVQVTVTDGNGGAASQAIAITVTNVNEPVNRDPVINSAAFATVPENQTSAIDVDATDLDNDTLTYTISGGADQNAFAINAATGVVTFKSAPDFENPTDAGANNVYDVQVTVTDGNGGAASQAIAITVTDRPGGDSRIIIPEFVARPHLIPGDERPTAILFRALTDTTVTVSQVGVASLKQQISLVDVNLASLGGRDDFGHYTADLIGGGMYALIFEAQSSDAIFLVRSSQGYQTLSGSVPTNILNPTDVNADGKSTAQDALLIINQMSQNIGEGEDVRAEQRPGRYYDVNRDGRVTAGDALRVINNLNNRNRRGEGEVLAIPSAIQLVDADANDDERPDTAPVDLVTMLPPGKFDGATPERLDEDVLEIDFATAVKSRVSNVDELLSDESLDDLLPY